MLGRTRSDQESTAPHATNVVHTKTIPVGGERRPFAVARGGVSLGAILTGVVVAFGALFLLSAVIGGVFATSGLDPSSITEASTREVGLGIGVGMIVAWFLASLWGGYTAGRMGRGAGVGNGILVPVVVLVIGVIIGAIVAALGATVNLNLPFTSNQLPPGNSTVYDLSAGFGVGILIAMLVGGALGGALGSRWHTKLERRAVAEGEARAEQERAEEGARANEAEVEYHRDGGDGHPDRSRPRTPSESS
jgi:hypothetical protein